MTLPSQRLSNRLPGWCVVLLHGANSSQVSGPRVLEAPLSCIMTLLRLAATAFVGLSSGFLGEDRTRLALEGVEEGGENEPDVLAFRE